MVEGNAKGAGRRLAQPTLAQWRELYAAAQAFYARKPWEWMDDTPFFGVVNPDTGEVGYCSVLGALESVFALVVYMGTPGLRRISLLVFEGMELQGTDAMHVQLALMASFEDRGELDGRDRAVIQSLGLSFRGRGAWPMFRHYEPGYLPWFVDRRQAEWLSVALRQAEEVAGIVREQGEEAILPRELPARTRSRGAWDMLYYVCVPDGQGKDSAWRGEWRRPAPDDVAVAAQRRVRVPELPGTLVQGGAWEVDYEFAPLLIQVGRPHFPRLCLFADRDTGMILGFHTLDPEGDPADFVEVLAELAVKHGVVPAKLYVARDEVRDLFAPVAAAWGCEIRRVKRLPALEEARDSMYDALG